MTEQTNWEERYHHAVEGGAESIRKANERADSFWEERRELCRQLAALEAERDSQAQLIARLVEALKEAHDRMDDMNAAEDAGGECRFCGSPPPYDVNGIKHADNCVLIIARAVLAKAQALTEKQANDG